jgi:hypothetical protein
LPCTVEEMRSMNPTERYRITVKTSSSSVRVDEYLHASGTLKPSSFLDRKMKKVLVFASMVVLSGVPVPTLAAPRCDFVSYIVKDGQCVDLASGNFGQAMPSAAEIRRNPLLVQNLRARMKTTDRGSFIASTITGQFVNRSDRTVSGAIASISIYRGNQLMGVVQARVARPIPPGGVASFEAISLQPGRRLVVENVEAF